LIDFEELTPSIIDHISVRLIKAESLTPLLEQSLQENDDLKAQINSLQATLNESQMDHLETFDDLESHQAQLEYLRDQIFSICKPGAEPVKALKALTELSHINLNSIGRNQSLRPQIPHTFMDLYYSMEQLPYLDFTGDLDLIETLDRDEIGTYSGKTWEGFKMLNDYARARMDGHDVKGIFEYLNDAPSGYFNNWSKTKLSIQESESTVNDQRLLNQRKFAVPRDVDPSGFKIMVSHLKIGQRLRAHFYEDVGGSGKIYIGYIGRHLDTTRSN